MSALPKWATKRQRVLDDARHANGNAHLESPEVPEWVEDTGEHDMTGTLTEALCNYEDKGRDKLNELLVLLCKQGDEIAQRKAVDLLDQLRAILTDHCIKNAQAWVDRELL